MVLRITHKAPQICSLDRLSYILRPEILIYMYFVIRKILLFNNIEKTFIILKANIEVGGDERDGLGLRALTVPRTHIV